MKFPAILASAALVASASALGSAEEHGHAHVARHSNRERRFGSPVARAIQARANNAGKFGGFGGGFGGQQNKGGNGGKVTTTAAKVSTTVANGGGGTNKQTTTTVAAVTTTNAAAATTTTTAASSTGGSTISCGTDPQTSHCLDPSVIMPGLALDGLQVPELNEVASLTSTNNYINFCLTQGNLPLTNGAQVKTGSCNQTPMGVIPAQTNMVSSKFVFPTNGGTIAADTDFTVQMAIQLETGNFVNAASNYYAAPQQVNSAGIVIGHSHVVIEALDSLDTTVASDPTQFSFFKGLNDAAVNGILTADVTGGLAAGFYKISSINTAANHQPFLAPVAQHGSLDDCVYFTVTASGAASGGNGAAAGGNGGGNAAATTTTAAAAVTTTTTAAAATTTTAAAAGNGGNGQSNNGQGNKGGNGGNGNAGNGGNNAIVAKTVTSTIQACAATPAAKLLAKRLADLEQLEA